MHKRLSPWVVAAAVIFTAAFITRTSALDISSWFTAQLNIQKQADTTLLPVTSSGYGNITCVNEDPTNCIFPTSYGEASSNSTVRFNSSDLFIPVITYMDQQRHLFPVPNSNVGISYYSGPPFGLYAAFNYDLPNSIAAGTNTYSIYKPPDGKLMDKSKRLLAADPSSISFSENGRYMVVSIPNTAIARVDLRTFDVLPFGQAFTYGIGLDPAAKTAITNDGRYAVVASNSFSTFKIYDLSTCAPVPDTISTSVSCQSRDLKPFMQTNVPSYSNISQARFMDSDTLAFYATYKSGVTNKTARFILSSNGSNYQQDLLALGDSYISGEGAFDYETGTDNDVNKCHVSYFAYPFLLGKDLNYNSYHSVACAGAVTDDITDVSDNYAGQNPGKLKRSDMTAVNLDSIITNFQPGYIQQLDFVKAYQPKTVLVSIGGNDMGFSKILTNCVKPKLDNTCYDTYEERLSLVHEIESTVYPNLTKTYNKIKNAGPPDMRTYVIGYPQIAKPGGDCGANVHLNSDEVMFSQQLINYLDTVIQTAASKTGVYYVDTQDALYGHRLCEAKPGSIAVNGVTAGNDRPTQLHGPIGNESYHPNDIGYQLLENRILTATKSLTNPMPAPDPSATFPSESSLLLLNAPKTGRVVNIPQYNPSIAPDLAYLNTPLEINITGASTGLTANTPVSAELHSTPIGLGNFRTDIHGNLSTQVVIPANSPAGYHTIHFLGSNIAGRTVDVYKYIYVPKSADDVDGNGINDINQKCLLVDSSGQDYDKDGIDDSCDPNIGAPPLTQQNNEQQPEFPILPLQNPGSNLSSSESSIQSYNSSPILFASATASGLPDNYTWEDFANISGDINGVASAQSVFNPEKPKAIALLTGAQNKNNNEIKNILVGVVLIIIGLSGLMVKRRV